MTGTTAGQVQTARATFRDTVAPQEMIIDSSFQGVFAYMNGNYAWPLRQLKRYAMASKFICGIDVNGTSPGSCRVLDVERFDATPAMAALWVPLRNSIAGDATVYCSRDSVAAVVSAIGPGIEYWLWTADWTGQPHIADLGLIPGVRQAAVQYKNTPGYDLTAVYSTEWLASL